jgi:hypothetical protein
MITASPASLPFWQILLGLGQVHHVVGCVLERDERRRRGEAGLVRQMRFHGNRPREGMRLTGLRTEIELVVLRPCCRDCPGLIRKARYSKGLSNTGRNTEF